MPRLSDPGTRAFKFRFIGSVAATVVAIAVGVCVFNDPPATLPQMGFVLVLALGAVAWSARKNPGSLADDVVDEGACLMVRRRSAQAQIAFDDIADICRDNTSFTRHVRISLARAVPPFGTEIVFRPRDCDSMTIPELNRLIEELRSRAPRAASIHAATDRSPAPVTAGDPASGMTFNQKRVILAGAVLLAALAFGNRLFEWNLFAPFDKPVTVGCIVAAALALYFFSPTVGEMDQHVDARIVRKGRKRESR